MQFTQQRLIHLLLNGISLFGLWVMYRMLEVNTVRGDEFLSFLHSDPAWTYKQVIQHIHDGADNSYVHAVLLKWLFGIAGHKLIVQRLLSMGVWMLAIMLLYPVIKRPNNKGLNSFLLVCAGFSNLGFFLATDGRFYSLLFCFAAASLLLFVKRNSWNKILLYILLFLVQMFGLLTSPNFIVFQLLFMGSMLSIAVIKRNREGIIRAFAWCSCIVLAALLYFCVFRIPYFHSYFMNGFFSAFPFRSADLFSFCEIPFRWFMAPHMPYASDKVDGLLLLLVIVSGLVYFRKKLVGKIKSLPENSLLLCLMAGGVVLLFITQIMLYLVFGFPLWESRYYAPVFFLVPVGLILLFRDVLTLNGIMIFTVLWLLRLVAVEYPKIEQREQALLDIQQKYQAIMLYNRPVLFVEEINNHQSTTFGLMGNLYVRYPNLRSKLFLKSDPAVPERTAYFQRLSNWHYPLGLVSEVDSTSYLIIR